jgi:hypothetical protein
MRDGRWVAALAALAAGLSGCGRVARSGWLSDDPGAPRDLAAAPADQAFPGELQDLTADPADLAPADDLAPPADLAPPEDLTPAADLTVPCGFKTCGGGCCAAGVCTAPSRDACGTQGKACAPCNPELADGCTDGACSCGGNPACGIGRRCIGGACACDAISCPNGCCAGDFCTVPSFNTCGLAGAACRACDANLATQCVGGECRCGKSPSCPAGLKCSNDQCVCDAVSCPDGCCAGGACHAPTPGTCGRMGRLCVACDGQVADACVNGACACGQGPPCGAGQACVAGACACNAQSCPTGCCAGDVCTVPGPANCGANGATCAPCNQGEQCIDGACVAA